MKKFILSNKYWIIAIVLLGAVAAWFLLRPTATIPDGVEIEPVTRGTVVETVSETGFVFPSQEVTLAFERGGKIAEIVVAEGAHVEQGDVLVRLDQAQMQADLSSALARLEAEDIRLNELLRGADTSTLAVTQTSVAAAETALLNAERNLQEVTSQQDQLVANAEKTLRTSGLQAYLTSSERTTSNDSFDAPTISGTYDHTEEGIYSIRLYNSNAATGASFQVSGLENDTDSVSTVNPSPIGDRGLYIQFPQNFAPRTVWEIPIPNTRSSTYLTLLNTHTATVHARNIALAAAESAVASAEAAVAQAKAQYTQVSGSAREERIAAQRALVRQMEASVAVAQVSLENTVLTAPFSGVITKQNGKIGEIVSPSAPIVSLISASDFDIVVSISESDIEHVDLDDEATVTLDAYDDVVFTARVSYIAPHAYIQDGVRVFEVKLQFAQQSELIRSGLSADIELTTDVRNNVIAVPSRAVVETQEGRFVRTLSNGTLELLPVKTGLRGSDGTTEILDGLTEGQEIIAFADSAALLQLESN